MKIVLSIFVKNSVRILMEIEFNLFLFNLYKYFHSDCSFCASVLLHFLGPVVVGLLQIILGVNECGFMLLSLHLDLGWLILDAVTWSCFCWAGPPFLGLYFPFWLLGKCGGCGLASRDYFC